MKKIFLFLFVMIVLTSCNPMMHIIGVGMRKFNTSQNKYSKSNPYYKPNQKNN